MEISNGGRFFWPALLAAAGLLWVLPISSGLWADETNTYWLIRGGLAELHQRSMATAQPDLYALVIWAMDRIGGHSEAVLRFPSLLAMAAAAMLFYALAREWFDRETALTALLLFALFDFVAFAACDARPYAFALLSAMASTLLLVRWLRTGRWSAAIGYAVTAAVMSYFQPVFVTILLVHAAYAAAAWPTSRRPTWPQCAAAALVYLLLLAPLWPRVAGIYGGRQAFSSTFAESSESLFFLKIVALYAPPVVLGGAVMALAGSHLAGWRIRWVWQKIPKPAAVMVLAWATLPVALPAAAAMFGVRMLVPRYVLCYSAGYALLLALGLRAVEPARVRSGAVTVIALMSVMAAFGTGRALEHSRFSGNWKAALQMAEQQSRADSPPVLFHSQFAGSENLDWRQADPRTSSISPQLGYYPFRAHFLVVPRTVTPAVATFLSELTASLAARRSRALLVTHSGASPSQQYIDWFQRKGWHVSLLGNFDKVLVIELRPVTSSSRF